MSFYKIVFPTWSFKCWVRPSPATEASCPCLVLFLLSQRFILYELQMGWWMRRGWLVLRWSSQTGPCAVTAPHPDFCRDLGFEPWARLFWRPVENICKGKRDSKGLWVIVGWLDPCCLAMQWEEFYHHVTPVYDSTIIMCSCSSTGQTSCC